MNLLFFMGEKKSTTGYYIDDLLKLKGNYKELEYNHAYIQWLFPNHFKSNFNSDSFPLTEEEAEQMSQNEDVIKNLYKKVM